MQKSVEKGRWEDQNQDGPMKFMETHKEAGDASVAKSCRQKGVEGIAIGSHDS
jgi:hypothetical protein